VQRAPGDEHVACQIHVHAGIGNPRRARNDQQAKRDRAPAARTFIGERIPHVPTQPDAAHGVLRAYSE
jgi:hypothetical protein